MRRFVCALAGAALVSAAMPPAMAVDAGAPAPSFALPTAAGDTVSLDRLRGKVVYVDFWASWCGPCRRSFPWMNEMHRKYGAKDFAIVAINVDKKRPDAERFLSQVPAEFTVVYDPAGTTPSAYGVKGMPSSYLVDATGRVVSVEQGFRDERAAELEAQVRTMLGVK